MLKKIILATALVATASFATWDKFPVLENHKGQAVVGDYFRMQDKASADNAYIGARFTVITGLELGMKLDYRMLSRYDGKDSDVDGLENIPLMFRYQFMPIMNAFLDVTLPVGSKEVVGEDDPFVFHFGAQYSQKFGMVNFGSEAGLQIETEGEDKTTPPWTLNLGAEADFEVNQMLTPYIGIDLYMLLGKTTYDGKNGDKDFTGDLLFKPYLGACIAFNQMLSLDISASLLFGNSDAMHMKSWADETRTLIDVHLNVNF